MKTALVVYVITWLIIIIPLVLFNLKRIRVVMPDGKKKPAWKFILFLALLQIVITILLVSSYQITIRTRYELAAERYVEKHAEFLVGHVSYEEYEELTAPLLSGNMPEEKVLLVPGDDLHTVRFQIGDWITPKNFLKEPGFPDVEIIDEEANPVFLFCVVDNARESVIYLLGMKADANGQNWKVFYYDLLPEEISNNSDFNSFRPNAKNGKWHYFSS